MRKLVTAAAISACALATGCGEKKDVTTTPSEQQQVTVAVHSPETSATVCIHAAHATGAYAQAGLKVAINALPDATAPSGQLTSGTALLAVMTPLNMVEQRDGGAPFISVAALNKVPLSWGAIDPKKVTKKTKVLRQRHQQAVTGSANSPEVLAATRDSVDAKGSTLRLFLQATGRACSTAAGYVAGWNEWVAAGGKDGSKKPKKLDPKKVFVGQTADLRKPGSKAHPWGWQSPAQWSTLVAALAASGQLRGQIAPDTVYTNEFLAGQGS